MGILGTTIFVSASALAIWVAQHNLKGRNRERQLGAARGVQAACDFAALFERPTERFVAEKIYPYLQTGTFTRQFSFRKDDLLWQPPLSFVQDDVEDNLRFGFWDELSLGLTAENADFAPIFWRAKTVGELISAIASIYESKYGCVESPSK